MSKSSAISRWRMVLCLSLMMTGIAMAEQTPVPKPHIDLAAVIMDNQKLVRATVTFDGKPLAGATVSFLVKRTFGDLKFGQDQTYDDGTAFTPFPSDMPGNEQGQLQLIARIDAPAQYKNAASESLVSGGLSVVPDVTSFPRSLWAPQAPLLLMLSIIAAMVVVWGSFAYVVFQLMQIRKGVSL